MKATTSRDRSTASQLVLTLMAIVVAIPAFFFVVAVVANTLAGELNAEDAVDGDDDVEEPDDYENPFDELGLGSWEETGDGTSVVRVLVPSDWGRQYCTASLRVTALLGALQHDWAQCGYELFPGETIDIELDVPDETFMHELAASFVTELRVHASVCGTSGLLGEAVLAWPDGQDGEPAVWTVEQMATAAPYGVLDSSLRAKAEELLESPEERLGPPITGVSVRARLDTGWSSIEELDPSRTDAEDEDGDAGIIYQEQE